MLQLNILQVQTQKYTQIIAEVWLNSTDILKQNSQIYKFLANIFTQQYNPLNFLYKKHLFKYEVVPDIYTNLKRKP